MGNHDEALLQGAIGFTADAKDAIEWTRKQLKPGWLASSGAKGRWDFIANLPSTYLDKDILYVHGSPRDPTTEYILESDTEQTWSGPPRKLQQIFEMFPRLCFVGHTHQPCVITEEYRFLKPQDFNYMSDGYIAWETFKILKTDVCFVGHTHTPGMFIKDNDEHLQYREDDFIEIKNGFKYIINVGSVGQPRDGNPQAAYCIYDTDKKEIRIKRIDYNIELTRKKIMAAGLSRSLADRLLAGR